MEGFMHWRIKPWVRRLITRLLAILPAVAHHRPARRRAEHDRPAGPQPGRAGHAAAARDVPAAALHQSSRKWMGEHKNGWFLLVVGWTSCVLITALDLYGLPEVLRKPGESSAATPVTTSLYEFPTAYA